MDAGPYQRPRFVWYSAAVAVGVALLVCPLSSTPSAAQSAGGQFRVLTYNVAGLPEGLSRSRPSHNMARISPLLNAYDVVLVQEDFAFQTSLRRRLIHRFISRPMGSGSVFNLGDGLSRFSLVPFRELERRRWNTCFGRLSHGSDCMAPKGFSVATHWLSDRDVVDVYNLHMDAGGSEGDRIARASQVEQLAAAILGRSAGRAVIVAGDTNMRADESSVISAFLDRVGLRDSCADLGCLDRFRVDRVLYRTTPTLELLPQAWALDPRFRDERGAPLSDHDPVSVHFRWRAD
jgi:endonuclease/exonuclease/phosphatase family metal-dependent hydrolase